MGKKRGSEGNPIDLTDDDVPRESPCKKKLKSTANVEDVEDLPSRFQKLSKSIETIENLCQKEQLGKSGSPPPTDTVTFEEKEGLFKKCQSLESRVSALESYLLRVKEAFVSISVDCSPINTNENHENATLCVIQEALNTNEHEGNKGTTCIVQETTPDPCTTDKEECDVLQHQDTLEPPAFSAIQALCEDKHVKATSGDLETASICSDETIINCERSENCLDSTAFVGINQATNSKETVTIVDMSFDSVEMEPSINNKPNDSNAEDTLMDSQTDCSKRIVGAENGSEVVEDIKPDPVLIKLPPLISVKQEVKLHRDEFGRILMFLYCSTKKIQKNSDRIVAVSGMYLTDQLHNEYAFVSESNFRDIKVEAEIKAALFGIEAIKSIFRASLGNQVCVMIISSCSQLVQFMKRVEVGAYPNFQTCSCVKSDCQHSSVRWITQDPLAISQKRVLPDLILSTIRLKVHWCLVTNISNEEKNILDEYKNVVDSVRDEYLRYSRKNLLQETNL